MVTYNWQLTDWPNFQFSTKSIEDELLLFSEKVGRVTGILEALLIMQTKFAQPPNQVYLLDRRSLHNHQG